MHENIRWKWWNAMGSFYGGTLADYIKYCDYRYSGKFKLKKDEDIFDGFTRWLKENEGIYNG
jgi:hypothetical protein